MEIKRAKFDVCTSSNFGDVKAHTYRETYKIAIYSLDYSAPAVSPAGLSSVTSGLKVSVQLAASASPIRNLYEQQRKVYGSCAHP